MTVNCADDFEQQLHFRADAPAGSEDIDYSILDGSIAQVDFTYSGKSYCLRASKQSGDFSGINGTLIKSDKIDAQTDAIFETIRGIEFNYFKLKWTNGAVTFILSNGDETTAESITEIYRKIKQKNLSEKTKIFPTFSFPRSLYVQKGKNSDNKENSSAPSESSSTSDASTPESKPVQPESKPESNPAEPESKPESKPEESRVLQLKPSCYQNQRQRQRKNPDNQGLLRELFRAICC